MIETQLFSYNCDNHSVQHQTEVYTSQMVEALNANKFVKQSEMVICGGFQHRNRAVFHSTPVAGASKNMASGSRIWRQLMALISGAGFWSTCQEPKTTMS